MRGWTPINDDDPIWTEDHYDRVKPVADALARQWSVIHDEAERTSFTVEDHWGGDYDWEPGEFEAHEAVRKAQRAAQRAQVESIEEQLSELGVRMMRPYEHWNEDEQYMQYMEVDRFA